MSEPNEDIEIDEEYPEDDDDCEHDWRDYYACENGCCSCCGCSCGWEDDDDYEV